MGAIQTVCVRRIDGEGGTFVINERDFDEKVFEKVEDPRTNSAAPEPPPPPPPGSAYDTTVPHVAGTEIVSLRDVISEQAVQVVFSCTDAVELKRLLAEEQAHPKYKGGRKAVLDGFEVRFNQLGIEWPGPGDAPVV